MLWVLLKGLWVSVVNEFLSPCHILRVESVWGSEGTRVMERQPGTEVTTRSWSPAAQVWVSAPSLTCLVALSKL